MRNLPLRSLKRSVEAGFTIVELMIATLVFSIVLLVITGGVLHFTHDYYQGVNTSTTQGITRSITDTISQAIQFSGAQPQKGPNYLCAGNVEYIFSLGTEVQDGSNTVGLQQAAITSGSCPDPSSIPSSSKTELLQPRMRLLQFDAKMSTTNNSLWTISIKVALGDNDQLCDLKLSGAGGCTSNTAISNAQLTASGADVHCKVQSASQFCDVAALTTVAQARIN